VLIQIAFLGACDEWTPTHRLSDPHLNTLQRTGSSTWLSLHLNLVLPFFHQQNLQHPCPVDSSTRWHPWQHTGGLEGQAGLHSSSGIGPYWSTHGKVLIWKTGQAEFHDRYMHDSRSATHRTLTGETSRRHTGDLAGPEAMQCITVAQLRTGHCPLLTSYLHRIGRQQSPACPHCGGDDETAQHLLLCCPSHAQARSSSNYINSIDPRRMWSFLESIGAVTRPPPTGNDSDEGRSTWAAGINVIN